MPHEEQQQQEAENDVCASYGKLYNVSKHQFGNSLGIICYELAFNMAKAGLMGELQRSKVTGRRGTALSSKAGTLVT